MVLAMPSDLQSAPVLLTGFPGFLSDHLLRELATRTEGELHLLCLPSMVKRGERRLSALQEEHQELKGRWQIHGGDITRRHLGLAEKVYGELKKKIGVVWHLAAIYDLAVGREVAYEVNVGGTQRVLEFCEAAEGLGRLNYVSTCYVSGERRGVILEEELDRGQGHKNAYEETKFWAEVEVQRRAEESGIPTAIFRPGITVGHSQTGEVNKYDGPYYVFRLLHRLPEWMPFPNVGQGDAVVNLVPIDFVARAMGVLGHADGAEGVFHLADPTPMRAQEIVDAVLKHLGRSPTVGSLPASWVERALRNSVVKGWTGVPVEALAYFNHDARYDTERSQEALERHGVRCPPLPTYLDRLLDYYLMHPEGPPGV